MKVLVGITGSIAAVKSVELVHQIIKLGYQCKVIITQDGLNFVTPTALSSMGAEAVYIDSKMDQYSYTSIMEHINLAKWADYILVAPLSANTLAKLAHGFSDNLLTATILASAAKKILVPAMNQQMWKAPITQSNLETIKYLDFMVWGPTYGLQACGDIDVGRMIEVENILNNLRELVAQNGHRLLYGKRVVITAGSTIEQIDPVRYISNHSSGKMGNALAECASFMGADVIMICGKMSINTTSNIDKVYSVGSAEEMFVAAKKHAKNADVFISCAAVCDYKIKNASSQKVKKSGTDLSLELTQNPDIVASIKKMYPSLFVVGFAAETNNVVEYGINKLHAKNLDMVVINDVSQGVFGSDMNQVTIIDRDLKQQVTELMLKKDLATVIWGNIVNYWGIYD
jgi:phosphopantothenoylcysteine decarboxylase/phosphopantothenate--cysteine ligase